jgi:hypothetical protein
MGRLKSLKFITLICNRVSFWHGTEDKAGKLHLMDLAGRTSFVVRSRMVSKKKVSWLKELLEANNLQHRLEGQMDLWYFYKENWDLFSIIVWLLQNKLLKDDLMKQFDPSDRKTKNGLESIMKTHKALVG